MVLKKLQFHLYNLILIILLVLQTSCDKKIQKKTTKKKDLTEIDKLISIGHKLYQNEEFDSSYYYFSKAKNTAETQKDTSRIVHSLSWLAQIQRNLGDFTGSEATAVEALPFLNNNKYPNGKWNIYNQLGNNYLFTFDNENALYYFKKALKLKTDPIENANMKNNIAYVLMEQGKYKDAIQILTTLTSKKEVLNDTETNSRILDNLGYCYYNIGNSKALDYIKRSLKIRLQKKNDRGLIGNYYHLSIYYKKTNLNLSNTYAYLGYKNATKVNSVEDRLQCLQLLIQNSTGNHSKKYSLLYLRLNDSIAKVRLKAKNQFAKIKYDSKKEKEENLKLKEQKVNDILKLQVQKSKTHVLYFVIIIIVILTGLIYYYLKDKNRREKIQAAYTTEIKIANKLHDELANDLYQMITFAETQDLSTENNKETLLNNLDTIYFRTRNISKENSYIDTEINFIPNLKDMMSDFNTDTTNLLINGLDSIDWLSFENTKKITVYRVLQELLVNMRKHSKSSLVAISFKINNKYIIIDYSDNGVGANFEQQKIKNGLQNVENRILAIKGTITFDTKFNKGFKVCISFPNNSRHYV